MVKSNRTPIDVPAATNMIGFAVDISKLEISPISPVFGCYIRNAVDAILPNLSLDGFSLIYFDIDGLREKNDLWGKTESSRRVKAALDHRQFDVMIGQWFSGDEFVVLVPTVNVFGCAGRLLKNFRAQEMSATFVIAECSEVNIYELVEACELHVSAMKQRGNRGVIAYLD